MDIARRISDALRSYRLPFRREDRLHAAVAEVLTRLGLRFESERDLGETGRIDFLVEQGVGVELKVKGSQTDVARQLISYATRPEVSVLVLVTARARLGALPNALMGKPVVVVELWRGAI